MNVVRLSGGGGTSSHRVTPSSPLGKQMGAFHRHRDSMSCHVGLETETESLDAREQEAIP